MSNQPPNDSSGSLDHLSLRYLRRVLDASHPTDEPYVLNEVEAWVIRRVRRRTIALAAALGALAVLLLYLPQYFWPAFFQEFTFTILGEGYDVPVISILYGVLLVYVEVYALMYVNLNAIRTIMAICQFPRAHDAQYDRHLKAIASVALSWKYGGIFSLGSDPHFGRPGWGLTSFFWFNTAKAFASDLLLRTLMFRFLGRFAFRQLTDLIGMPVFAFWNAFASFQILREAQIRVMAPLTIRSFVDELHEELGSDEAFCQLIPEALRCIGVQRRQYNYAHLFLFETIEDRFGIKLDTPSGEWFDRVPALSTEARSGLERLIIFSALVDGRLSWAEKKCLGRLHAQGIVSYTIADIRQIGKQYNDGKGLWV
ncbi:hypothetical protein F5984_18150 [Rudanella paleaurantiibacter]|uniref:Uncharacterized protein n=1 Tax=Rudanella paleaurantiibacter TaxID=2614655 RepID=A0A7J5TWC6_9BACT|nr:hypothetical protein [Rudanella paleaurantiibacter]KAB7728750.1 hypothetical protein F5984_18150 [Rudanella paleaurantiibacter]